MSNFQIAYLAFGVVVVVIVGFEIRNLFFTKMDPANYSSADFFSGLRTFIWTGLYAIGIFLFFCK